MAEFTQFKLLEWCLVDGARERQSSLRLKHSTPQVLLAPLRGHSEKPEGFYDLLRRVSDWERVDPDVFGRRRIAGFTSLGATKRPEWEALPEHYAGSYRVTQHSEVIRGCMTVGELILELAERDN